MSSISTRGRAMISISTGPVKMTPARAAKIRREKMAACGCLLCNWALHPATSIDEFEERLRMTYTFNDANTWPQKCTQQYAVKLF